ncbi:MAG TPA: tripartite tricarboxylate transporter substrate binding protein [Candidatus Ruania gallistercoris]|uniref:Tripartite tricarboxylate transporter substrate binding protein n=1 Tax=Candidatus Ruania gallistercoris TaxID=2838746 RepID=A0A9D2EH44_9MICO|nr:tripartite tricarboxylate transporter substrate binding protein [Candidatus Ruania gallistercoris]
MRTTPGTGRRSAARWIAAAAAAGVLLSGCGSAGPYPDGTVELMIPWSAGGGSDLSARLFVSELEEPLEATISPVNEPGANGAIGWGSLAQADNDGYDLGLLTYDVLSNEILDPTSPTLEDFDILAQYEQQELYFYVPADSPYQTAADLEGSTLTVGTSGMGGIDHQAPAALARELGVDWEYVPFDGQADGLTNLLGGNIDAFVFTPTVAAQYVEDGTLRIVGTFADERTEEYPEVETFVEQGYEVPPIASFRGIAAPAGLDEETRATLVEAIETTVENEEYLAAAEEAGNTPRYRSGEEFEAYMNELRPTIAELLQEMGLAQAAG